MPSEAGYRIREDVAWTGNPDRVAVVDLTEPGQAPLLLFGDAALIWIGIGRQDDRVALQVASRDREFVITELCRRGLVLAPAGPVVDALTSERPESARQQAQHRADPPPPRKP